MRKADYLDDPSVVDFTAWMAQHLRDDSTLSHHYTLSRGMKTVRFANLADAWRKYDWPFRLRAGDPGRRTFAENSEVLGQLQARLREAVRCSGHLPAREACDDIMRWGGVTKGNLDWLLANQDGFADYLREVAAHLRDDDLAPARLGGTLRFNAGMTKVYSLLLDGFVIYDSRVAGALGWFVLKWAIERGRSTIPEALRFAWMPANEGPNARIRKIRNPSLGEYSFPRLHHYNDALHARWNLRANWLLEAVLASASGAGAAFGHDAASARRLEAALFMWGYDLGPNMPAQPLQAAA